MARYDFRDKTVVVTGASMGIGASFARELARQGARLVLVARSRDRLEQLARELGGAEVIVEDLATAGAAARIATRLGERGRQVDVLINNAGFGLHEEFTAAPLAIHRDAIAVNVAALVELSHTFLPEIERRRGGIIHLASTAGFQPVPYMAVYGATKAFVLSFSEALWGEYRARGVRVVALCPGATDTPFFHRARPSAAVGKKATPEALVEFGLEAFHRNRPSAVHGRANAFLAWLSRLTTRAFTIKLAGRMMRRRLEALPPAARQLPT